MDEHCKETPRPSWNCGLSIRDVFQLNVLPVFSFLTSPGSRHWWRVAQAAARVLATQVHEIYIWCVQCISGSFLSMELLVAFFRTKIPSQMPLKISTLMSTERYWYDHCRYMNLEMNWFRLRPLLLSANLKIKSEFSDYNQLIKCVLLVDNNKWSLDCNRFIFTWLVTCNFSFKVWA